MSNLHSELQGNPFLTESVLPYYLPDFSSINNEHYAPAIRAGMQAELEEIEQVLNNPAPASVSNTLVPFDLGGTLLGRALTVFYNKISADASDELEDIDESLSAE